MKTALIGFGYWGSNIARNLAEISDLECIVDINTTRVKKVARKYNIRATANASDIWSDTTIEAVAIATPPSTHYALVKAALESNKHVFVEKPLTDLPETAKDLYKLSEKHPHLTCCVGHIFMFSSEILAMKRRINQGEIGDLKLINIYRLNLGRYQPCGIKMDLLPHDISIIQYLANAEPMGMGATMVKFKGIESAGATQFRFKDSDVVALLNVSWIHTEKTRKIIAIGDKGTLEYDMNNPHTLRYFENRYIEKNQPGNIKVIEVKDHSEPLRAELQYFLDLACGTKPPSELNRISFKNGYAVVRAISELRNVNG